MFKRKSLVALTTLAMLTAGTAVTSQAALFDTSAPGLLTVGLPIAWIIESDNFKIADLARQIFF
jgi:hypothetical protein